VICAGEGAHAILSAPQHRNRQSQRDPEAQRLVMSLASGAICAILAYLSYNDGNYWQVPVWLGIGAILVAVPILPWTSKNHRLVQSSRWLAAAIAIGFFVWEIIRRRRG